MRRRERVRSGGEREEAQSARRHPHESCGVKRRLVPIEMSLGQLLEIAREAAHE